MDNKIPKIIHYCWFGKNPEPALMRECIKSWHKFFPVDEYEYKLWNEDTFDLNSHPFVKQAYENKKWAFITDYVRLWALYNYGGIYADTDVEILKPMDIFLNENAFSGFEDEQYIPTGIMGAKPGNVWIKSLLSYYDERAFVRMDGSLETTPNTKIITEISVDFFGLKINNKKQTLLNSSVTIYPKDYFCPKNHYSEKIILSDNSYAIHHFSGSWKTPKDKFKQKIHKMIISLVGENAHQVILKKLKGL
ncbi:glycosyltransferase family 32 protein [Aeromonas veronii]|uniref:glycosyltransferase family 32 protein n=1 Tax=Aeromonas veronii TaxID=654 RepID=UPI003A3068F5